MSFAQGSGPPASAKQMSYLLSLLQASGHQSFRDARYPLGLTQRQAGGKFSTKEASALIDQLAGTSREADDEATAPQGSPRAAKVVDPTVEVRAEREAERAAARLAYRQAEVLGGIPADMLAIELERRGWTCSPPE
jgi:MoxR-like ATPase